MYRPATGREGRRVMRRFFLSERPSTRRALLVLVAVVVFVSAAGVVALAQPDGGEVFTGCLNENSGALRNVASVSNRHNHATSRSSRSPGTAPDRRSMPASRS